ncbi:hypothetical protein ACEWY4_004530 [Coilia grayii]|uniref:MOB kinase activator 3B n=1 Tax=Coilia grayii TaxID=363190 RepID=A0ABD1KLY7_9TELE
MVSGSRKDWDTILYGTRTRGYCSELRSCPDADLRDLTNCATIGSTVSTEGCSSLPKSAEKPPPPTPTLAKPFPLRPSSCLLLLPSPLSSAPLPCPLRPADLPASMSIALKQVFNKDKTFRPKRKFEPGTQRFELHKRAQASLNSGVDLRAAVQLPHGEDLNDWVAVHVVDFFNRINLIYGTVCEFCTEKSCPVMSGGPRYEYRWQDEHKYKRPTPLPAPTYMNLLMDWIEMQINNEDIFPTSVGESLTTL